LVTVDRRAVSASSAWFEGEMDVGSDTSRYLLPFDMVAAVVSGRSGRDIGGYGNDGRFGGWNPAQLDESLGPTASPR